MTGNAPQPMRSRPDLVDYLSRRAWRDPSFHERLVGEPRSVLAEVLGAELPETLRVTVLDEEPNHMIIVLPIDPTSLGTNGRTARMALRFLGHEHLVPPPDPVAPPDPAE